MRAIVRGRNGAYEKGVDKGISDCNELIPIEGGEGIEP